LKENEDVDFGKKETGEGDEKDDEDV